MIRLLREDADVGATELFHCFSGQVKRRVWRLLGADADHDDVVQQVFCRILRDWPTVKKPSSLPSWVHAVTTNTVHQELRRRQVRRRFLREADRSACGDLVSEVELRELLLAVIQTVEKLPAGQRRAFMLRYVEGKPVDRVAEACDVSVSTVQRRLRTVSRRFDQCIAPDLMSQLSNRRR